MFENLQNRLKNYYLKKKFTSFKYTGKEDNHALAALLYPNGIWIKKQNDDIDCMSEDTRCFSHLRNISIYNATTLNSSGIYASADILTRKYNSYTDRGREFDIIEVYDNDLPKEQIINDMAFKKFAFETNDFGIKKCIVLYPKKYQIGEKINIADYFIKEDITKQVEAIYANFRKISYQDTEDIPLRNKSAKFNREAIYIDYSHRYYWKNKKYYDFRLCPFQYKIRAKIGNEPQIKHFSYDTFKRNHALLQINFLTGLATDYDTVCIRNAEFEKAHHREMAKMFPEKSSELYSLNEKIAEWENYFPIRDEFEYRQRPFSFE